MRRKVIRKPRRNKRNRETSKYRSKFEQRIAENLANKRVKFEYETQSIPYIVEKNYKPDFILPNGILVEAKGYFRSQDQRKHRLLKEQHPELDIRMLVMKLDARVQGSKMTWREWCIKYDIKYAENEVPREWLNEQKLQITNPK